MKGLWILVFCAACDPPRGSRIVVGAKNFTEQVVLGELLAQEIEATGEAVDRRFYLAGSYIAHQALLAGRIDAYVEYTGTALTSILKQPIDVDRDHARQTVSTEYEARYHVLVGAPLGFENTFALAMRGDDAKRLGVHTLSELARVAPQLRLGVGYEFEERPDGLPGLQQAYGLKFASEPRVMDLGLLYRALQSHQVDVVSGNSTDGAIAAMGLVVLEDDRHYFPPYEAVPLVREDILAQHPTVRTALARLAGTISQSEMQRLNHEVEVNRKDPAEAIRELLRSGPRSGPPSTPLSH